jgi:hypothetical protein
VFLLLLASLATTEFRPSRRKPFVRTLPPYASNRRLG